MYRLTSPTDVNSFTHGVLIRSFFFCILWCFDALENLLAMREDSPRVNPFLGRAKGSAGITSFICKPTNPESIAPTTFQSISHTASQYSFPLNHPTARYQAAGDHPYCPRPMGILQTAQSWTVYPYPAVSIGLPTKTTIKALALAFLFLLSATWPKPSDCPVALYGLQWLPL